VAGRRSRLLLHASPDWSQSRTVRRPNPRREHPVSPGHRVLVVEPALPPNRARPLAQALSGGLATAICYTCLDLYIAVFASSSIVSNETTYGPIGAVMTLLIIQVGLGVALHLGAVIGAPLLARAPKTEDHNAARRSPASPSGRASVPPLGTDGPNSRPRTRHLPSTLSYAPHCFSTAIQTLEGQSWLLQRSR
jgi:hypothetical protein